MSVSGDDFIGSGGTAGMLRLILAKLGEVERRLEIVTRLEVTDEIRKQEALRMWSEIAARETEIKTLDGAVQKIREEMQIIIFLKRGIIAVIAMLGINFASQIWQVFTIAPQLIRQMEIKPLPVEPHK